MTIFRVQKRESYVVLDKGFLINATLSWQAKGMLAYMLSLPNDWTFSIADLSNRSKNGRDATNTVVKELCTAGYIQKQQKRAEKGKFSSAELLVFEIPSPLTENPSTDNPQTEKPSTENPSLLINKSLNNNLLSINNNNDDDKGEPVPVHAIQNQNQKPPTAFQFYEQNGFGLLIPHVADKVGAWIDDVGEDLVIHAMKLAIENNVLRWNYVETILRDWSNKKLKSVADVEADNLRYKAQQQQKQNAPRGKKNSRTEHVPDWFHKRNQQQDIIPEQDADIDFEEERRKLLEKLGRSE